MRVSKRWGSTDASAFRAHSRALRARPRWRRLLCRRRRRRRRRWGRRTGRGGRRPHARPGAAGEVILEITRGGETLARWSLERIEAELDFVEATIDGEEQRGPRLLDLLAASAVDDWSKIEISGQGPQRAFGVAIKVESSAVDERWLLAVSRRGDLKLVSPSLARERWIRDVSEIEIVE